MADLDLLCGSSCIASSDRFSAASTAFYDGFWGSTIWCATLIATLGLLWLGIRIRFTPRNCHPQRRPRGKQIAVTTARVLMIGVWIVALGGNIALVLLA